MITDDGRHLFCDLHANVWPPDGMPRSCRHIEEYIADNSDAEMIKPPCRIEVGVIPLHNLFVEVKLGEPDLPSSPMSMEYITELGVTRSISLGYWNVGEGRKSIRAMIANHIFEWIDLAQPLKCPNRAHGLQQAREMDQILGDGSTNSIGRKLLIWDIAMEGMCTPCKEYVSGGGDPDSNFGVATALDPSPAQFSPTIVNVFNDPPPPAPSYLVPRWRRGHA